MSNKVYQMVTDRIINELESGIIPWKKPWISTSLSPEVAFNRISKKPYSLLNQMLLGHPGEYATYKQWESLGGHVKRGQKSSFVVYWNMIDVEDKDEDGNTVETSIPILRYYHVFHISQVDNVDPLKLETILPNVSSDDTIESAEDLVNRYVDRENIKFVQSDVEDAYYSAFQDKVVVPSRERHVSLNEFYSTVFHELIHSTGHPNRLGRIENTNMNEFDSDNYSKEELVAEIGSATILNMFNIETKNTFRNSSGYIQGWLKKLKSDPKFIVSAGGKASKAIDFILGEDINK